MYLVVYQDKVVGTWAVDYSYVEKFNIDGVVVPVGIVLVEIEDGLRQEVPVLRPENDMQMQVIQDHPLFISKVNP